MTWIALYRDLPYDKAMLKARKAKDEEAKLRKLGSTGNYSDVAIRLTSDLLGHKLYGVFVLPISLEMTREH
jgi:hypothetical protein